MGQRQRFDPICSLECMGKVMDKVFFIMRMRKLKAELEVDLVPSSLESKIENLTLEECQELVKLYVLDS